MSRFSRTVIALVATAAVGAATQSTLAQIVSITLGESGPVWPSDPFLETYDPSGLNNDFGGAIFREPGQTEGGPGRVIGQSFRVPSATSIVSFYTEIQYQGEPGTSDAERTYSVGLYEVADTTIQGDQDPGLGTLLAEGIIIAPQCSSCPGDETILRYDLATPVPLSPQAGNAGYAIAFKGANDPTDHGAVSVSTRSTSSPSIPPPSMTTVGGSYFGWETFPTGNGPNAHRAGALAVIVPEPGSLALLGLGGMLMLRRRKHA